MTHLRNLLFKRPIQIILILASIFCLSLLAIQPFTLNQMPETADGILHLYRTVVADYSLKVDHPLWARYSTGVVYGYGSPLFNYFPPLSYYPGSWLHTLGLTYVQSWLTMMMIYTFASALGMFLLGRIWTQSNVGGWVTAAAYIYAPYFLFDSVARGTSSELAALAVLPYVFYGFTRLAFYGRRRDFIISVSAFALFIPMHTLITLHGTVILMLYCLFLWITSDDKKLAFFRLLFAGGLGLMITAFFWLPAIVETDAVKINLIADQLDQIDVTRHLRPLGDLLALPHTADPTRQGQPIPITLSVIQVILSAFGLIIAWNDRNPLFRNLLIALWAIVGVLIFLTTPTSSWIWENVPLIGFTQFPWRILGLASLLLALMTGISVWLSWMIIPAGWTKTAVFGVLTVLIVAYGIPWTYSLYLPDLAVNDIRDVHDFERETQQLTVSSYSEYLPVSADESQLDADKLIERFENGDIIPRLLPSETTEIISEEWTSTSGRLTIDSSESQTLIFDWLYVEGWIAEIDGEQVEVYPSSPVGLVAIDILDGEFDITISLQPTSVQSVALVLSGVGILAVIGIAVIWRFIAGFSNLHHLQLDPEFEILAVVVSIGLGIFLFKAVMLDFANTQFRSSQFGDLTPENAQITPLANFDNQINLIDVKLPSYEISRGLTTIKLYWKLHDTPIDRDYSSIVRMLDPQGIPIAEVSSFMPGGLASSNWLGNTYILDEIEFSVPQFAPRLTGDYLYTFEVSLYDAETLEQLSVINTVGNPEASSYQLAEVNIARPERYSSNNQIVVENIISLDSDEVGLFNQDVPVTGLPDSITVGDEFTFGWTWQALTSSSYRDTNDLFAELFWRNTEFSGYEYRSETVPLVFGYPKYLWSRREVVTGHHRLFVPASIIEGDYKIGVRLRDANGNTIGIHLLSHVMTVTEPDRIFDEPEVDTVIDRSWENGIYLVGYSLIDSSTLELVWQTYLTHDKSYRLFVHILNDDDLIVTQSDSVPADWTRPTTGWVPDEYIVTQHKFDLSSGEYRILVGWYDPLTGDRVKVGSTDALLLDSDLIVD